MAHKQMEVVSVAIVKELNPCKLGVFAVCKTLLSSLHSKDFKRFHFSYTVLKE